MEYDAVLFDNDGVLTTLTSRDLLRDGIREALAAHGVSDPPDSTVDSLLSVTAADVVEVGDEHGIDSASLWQRREEIVAERQIEALRAGAKTVYDDAGEIGSLDARLGIVSNNQQRTIDHIVDQFGLDWAEVAYGREPTLDGVRRKKPTPYYLEAAFSDLGISVPDTSDAGDTATDDILYVGDSPKDLVAARRVGAEAAFVRRSHRADTDLPYEPAHEVTAVGDLVERLGR